MLTQPRLVTSETQETLLVSSWLGSASERARPAGRRDDATLASLATPVLSARRRRRGPRAERRALTLSILLRRVSPSAPRALRQCRAPTTPVADSGTWRQRRRCPALRRYRYNPCLATAALRRAPRLSHLRSHCKHGISFALPQDSPRLFVAPRSRALKGAYTYSCGSPSRVRSCSCGWWSVS